MRWGRGFTGALVAGLMVVAPLAQAGDFEDALKIASDPQARATRGADAERLFLRAADAGKNAPEALYNAGLLQLRRGDQAAARASFTRAVSVSSGFTPAKAQLLGLQLAERGGAAAAVEQLEAIVREDPFQVDAQNLLTAYKMEQATALSKTNKKAAAEMFEAARVHGRNVLAGNPDNIDAYLNIAITYYREGLFDQAGLVAKSALETHPNAAALENVLGLVALTRDDSRAATDAFLAALKDDPQDNDVRLNLAALELAYGNFASALKRFDEVAVQRPNDAMLQLSRGVALRGLERFDEAAAAYATAKRLDGQLGEADYNLCVLHQQYTQKYEVAKQACQAYLSGIDKANPKFAEVTKRVKSLDAVLKVINRTP